MNLIRIKDVEIFSISDANILGGSSIIYSRDFADGYLSSPFVPDREWLPEEIASRLFREVKDGCLEYSFTVMPQFVRHISSPVVPFNTLHSSNYFHFLIESVPGLLMLLARGHINSNTVLVSGCMHSNMIEALNIVFSGLSVSIQQLDIFEYISCDVAICGVDSFYVAEQHDGFLSSVRCNALNLMLTREYFKKYWNTDSDQSKLKLFVDRQSSCRNLSNRLELVKAAKSRGYIVVDPGKLGFLDQIRLFSSASHICGSSGAWAANLLFTPDDAKITILSPASINLPSLWVGLGNAIGLEVKDVSGPVTNPHLRQPIHSDFEIPEDIFMSLL